MSHRNGHDVGPELREYLGLPPSASWPDVFDAQERAARARTNHGERKSMHYNQAADLPDPDTDENEDTDEAPEVPLPLTEELGLKPDATVEEARTAIIKLKETPAEAAALAKLSQSERSAIAARCSKSGVRLGQAAIRFLNQTGRSA